MPGLNNYPPYREHEIVKDAGVDYAAAGVFGMGVLQAEMDLAMLVNRTNLDQFKGEEGDTRTFKVPGFLPAREYEFRNDRTDPIQLDHYAETKVDITMSGNAYSAVPITDEQADFDLRNGAPLMAEQAKAVGTKLNHFVSDSIEASPFNFVLGGLEQDMKRGLVRANRMLDDFNAPRAGRMFVVGTAFAEEMINNAMLTEANIVGGTRAQTMLEQNTLGYIRGVPVYQSNVVAPEFGALFAGNPFVLATASPLAPNGAPFVRYVSDSGISMRWIMDYDAMRLVDRSVVNVWYGGMHPLDFLATYDKSDPAAPIMKRSEGMHFLRGIKLTLDGTSQAPAAGTELATFTGYSDANLWTPTATTP